MPANRPLRVLELSEKTREFFSAHGVPDPVRDFLTRHAFDHNLTIGNHTFDSVESLPGENLEDEQRCCIEDGLLIIGCALNGDPIALDIRTGTVGFVLHDELWEEDSVEPRTVLSDTGLDIGSFYLAAARYADTFPVVRSLEGRASPLPH